MDKADDDPYQIFATSYDMLSRLQNVITFTFIRFLYQLLVSYIDEVTIFFVCSLLITIMYTKASDEISLAHDIFRTVTLIFSQNIINMSTDHEKLFSVSARFDIQIIFNFTVATIMLMLSSEIFTVIRSKPWVKQITTLILFMYAEAMLKIVTLLQIGNVILVASMLVYFLIFRYKHFLESLTLLKNVIQAVQMTSINVILALIVPIQSDSPYVHTGFLILILLIVDMMASILSILTESREYTLWKVSSRLAVMYSETQMPVTVSGSFLIILFYLNSYHMQNTQTLFEVSILTLLNTIVDVMAADMLKVSGVQMAIDAFVYTILFSSTMRVLKRNNS